MTVQVPDIEAIFSAALERRTPEERAAYLAEACAGDAVLLARVQVLLNFHDVSRGPLDVPAVCLEGTVNLSSIGERPGTQIGPYKLLQQIGEGGMGVVWMAEQTEPVQRKVALKLIKPGMDSRQVIARFEAERQALAMMDHVNIARVFDGGTTGGEPGGVSPGRPYFVMELVHGVPITKYCDDNHLTPRQRLELFVPVCQAIQHAHQKGIIHRDIKPSNVMVTLYDGKPVPKVIDFGVAKATEQKLTERTLFTQYGAMVGTLEYMSPEQAEMSALGVDTRSDIYSLGVLLYELLTGSTPLTHKRMKEAAYAEILRMIKEEEPPRPSTRLSDSGEALASISAQRHTEPAKLTKLVRGELDWIVMKTLEKDRNRRYETAKDFAADVQRYLGDEPVQACPPSAGYRFRKFARRNKRALMSAAVLAVAVLVVAGTIGWAVRDRDAHAQEAARERAARQLAVEQEVNLELKEAEQWQEQARWQEALSAAKRAQGLLAGSGSDELRERVHQLRKDFEMVLRLEDIPLLSSEIKKNKFDMESADRAYAQAFADYGIDVASLPADEAAARIRARPRVAVMLAAALDEWAIYRGRKDYAGFLALKALAEATDPDPWRRQVRQAVKAKDTKALTALAASPELLRQPPTSLRTLSGALHASGLKEAQIELLRRAQWQYPGDFWINHSLGSNLREREPPDRDEAISFLRAALAVRPRNTEAHNALGLALSKQGKFDEAIACYRKLMEIDPAKSNSCHLTIGSMLARQKKPDEAIAAYHKVIEVDPKNAAAYLFLGVVLRDQKKLDEAIAAYRKAIDLSPKYIDAHMHLGHTLRDQKKLDEAIAAYQKAIEVNPKYVMAYAFLGGLLRDQKKWDEAIACYRKWIEVDPKDAQAQIQLGHTFEMQQKPDEAIAVYRQALERLPDEAAWWHGQLARVLWKQGRLEEAAASHRQAIKLHAPGSGLFYQYYYLGRVLNQQKKPKEAVDALRKAIDINPKYAPAHHQLGMVLGALGQDADAITCYRKAIEIDANDPLGHQLLVEALQKSGKPDLVVAALHEWVRARPADVSAHYRLGAALVIQKKPDEAIAAYRKAIDINPKYAPGHYQLGLALVALGQDADAIACYRKAIEVDPKFTQAYINLGNALCAQKKLDEAIAEFRQAVTLEKEIAAGSPQVTPSQFSLANLLNDRAWQLATGGDPKSRDPKRALDLSQEAAALLPNSLVFRNTLGVAHYRAGNWKDAVEVLAKSRQLTVYSKDSVILFFLSMAHGRLNEKEQARTFFDQAAHWRMGIGVAEEDLRRLCAEAAALLDLEVPPTLTEPPVLTPGPTLLKPAAEAALDNGTVGGTKLRVWEFDWSDVPGATQHQLIMTGPIAGLWVINDSTLTASTYRYEAKGYLSGQTRLGWRWKVRALVEGVWTDWSEERSFEVAPPDDNRPASPKK